MIKRIQVSRITLRYIIYRIFVSLEQEALVSTYKFLLQLPINYLLSIIYYHFFLSFHIKKIIIIHVLSDISVLTISSICSDNYIIILLSVDNGHGLI